MVILSADDWVYIFFVCCLEEVSRTGYYWCLDDAVAYSQVFSFAGVLTI